MCLALLLGKHVEDIDLAEAATLAAIPKSPNYYNPLENPKASKERQELVLDQMVKYGYITQPRPMKPKPKNCRACKRNAG